MTEQDDANKLEHPCFPQPPDPSVRVWRYMDLAKLVWMLDNRKLHLSRLNLLGDPHEGSTPRLLAELRDQQIRELTKGKTPVDMAEINQRFRKSMFVNCWQLGNSESEAMWRLYCPGGNGVAIQTTYQDLVDSVSDDPSLFIGCITYIDYDSTGFPIDNAYYPAMHKRMSFAHEKEVRLVKQVFEYMAPEKPSPTGITVEWPIGTTADRIFVSPYASEHFQEAVVSVVRELCPDLADRIEWSKVRADPVY